MTTRRTFIKNSGTLIAGAAITPLAFHKARAKVSANDKLTVALIGCKGMGMYNLTDHLQQPGIECAALCDVDSNILQERTKTITELTGKSPKQYNDYRRVIEDKDIDIVIIGTAESATLGFPFP